MSEHTPKCPQCGSTLYRVTYPSGSMLNRDQWESVRAGDWYCTECTSDVARSGYAYFWDREVRQCS